jgi:hypothetical protein
MSDATSDGESARDPESEIEARLARLQQELDAAQRRARTLMHDHPLLSFFGAVAAGYLIGRLLRRGATLR